MVWGLGVGGGHSRPFRWCCFLVCERLEWGISACLFPLGWLCGVFWPGLAMVALPSHPIRPIHPIHRLSIMAPT